MAKITFAAELRIPRQIILPLAVAHTAAVARTLLIDKRTMDVDPAIGDHLEQRYPKWIEPKQADDPPGEKPLDKMTIAELTELAAREGIDLGKAKLHADIVKVIADYKPSDDEDEQDQDADEADEDQAEDTDA